VPARAGTRKADAKRSGKKPPDKAPAKGRAGPTRSKAEQARLTVLASQVPKERSQKANAIARLAEKVINENPDDDDAALLLVIAGKRKPTEYLPEFGPLVYKLCLLGHTNKELAAFLEVTEQTISEWLATVPAFRESVTRGRDFADAQVAHAMFKRAVGCDVPDSSVNVVPDGVGYGRLVVTPMRRHFPPDVGAATIWLSNKNKERWRKDPHAAGGADPSEAALAVREAVRAALSTDAAAVAPRRHDDAEAGDETFEEKA
jgi:hypothetical protein